MAVGDKKRIAFIDDISKEAIGLSNVDNTSDINKPISTAQQTEFDKKVNNTDFATHTDNTTVHLTSEERDTWNDKASKPKYVTTTLTVSGWTGDSPYTQTVSVSGITTTNSIIPTPTPESWELAGKNSVYCSSQAVDSLIFSCKKKPESDLTYNILIQEV